MRYFITFLVSCFVLGFVYAEEITITTTTEELRAVEGIVVDAQEWLQSAWDGKANKCMEKVILIETDKNPRKLTKQQKKDLINNINFKSRLEKDLEE